MSFDKLRMSGSGSGLVYADLREQVLVRPHLLGSIPEDLQGVLDVLFALITRLHHGL